MKQKTYFATAAAAWAAFGVSSAGWADTHAHKTVQVVEIDMRPCVFFTLDGVPLADAALPSAGGWFSLPRTHPNFTEIYSAVLGAKLAGKSITVGTTGTAECSYAGVSGVDVIG